MTTELEKKKQVNVRLPIAHWIALQTHLKHPLKNYTERGALEKFLVEAVTRELNRRGVKIPQLSENISDKF